MFGLIWTEDAHQELSDLYVDARQDEREFIAAGIDGLNNALRLYPLEVGESRDGHRRVTFVGPVVVRFEINPTVGLVIVYHVRRGR